MGGISRPQDGLVFGVYIDGVLCAVESLQIDIPIKDVPLAVFEVAATHGKRAIENKESTAALRVKELESIITSAKKTISTPVVGEDLNAALKVEEAKRNLRKAEDELNAIGDPIKEYIQENLTWRHLLPNAKVHILFRDTNWEEKYPRFSVFFEGEVMSTGFNRSPSSRSFRFQAYHITQGLEYTEMEILDGAGATQDTITQNTRGEGVATIFDITGNFLTALSPEVLSQKSGIDQKDLDIHQFCKQSFNVFLDEISNSSVRNNYFARAARFYDMANRMNAPEERQNKMNWTSVYQYILEYSFKNLMPTLGTRISYFNLISYISQVFLHEFMIHPAPTHVKNQILIKPRNVFMPVPNCNIIYPIHGANYSHRETYKNKPTRHKLTLDPPYGNKSAILSKYYTVYSPKLLRDRLRSVEGADAVTIKGADLITEEERERGIIPSYNNLPPIITSLLELLSVTDANGNIINNPKVVKGAGDNFSDTESSPSSITGNSLDDSQIKAIEIKLELHKQLLVLEGVIKKDQVIDKQELKKYNSSIQAAHRYKPNRITIVPTEKIIKMGKNIKNQKKVNYNISDGKIKRVLGREFHIFEEPTDSIPLMIKINESSETLESANKQNIFLIGGSNAPGAKMDKTYELKKGISRENHIKNMLSFTTGGFHQSLVIAVDEKESSKKALIELVAVLAQMCDIPLDLASNKGNIRFLSDYFGDGFITENIDEELRTAMQASKKLKATLVDNISKILPKSSDAVTLGSIRVSGERDIDQRLSKILSVNEASGEQKYRVGYNYIPSDTGIFTEFVFGGAQFTLNASYIRKEWYLLGISNADINRLKVVVATKPRSVTAMPYDIQKLLEEITLKIKAKRDLVDTLDINQRKVLILSAASQIRTTFKDVLFEGYSPFGQLCDIFNQWGEQVIASHLSTSIPLLVTNGKMYKQNILNWRYASADHPKSKIDRPDQKRRHDNIERLYNESSPTFITVDELLKSVGDTSNLSLKDTKSSINSAGVGSGGSEVNNSNVSGSLGNNVDVSNMNIKDLNSVYTEPIADYHFYESRYKANQDSISIAFHPYLYPGYPSLILDSSELQAHVMGYLTRVSYSQHSSGNLSTNISLDHLRRADTLGLTRDISLTHGANNDGFVPTSVPEALKDGIPFFAGEYEEEYIDATYKRLIGCERAITNPIPDTYLEHQDLKSTNKTLRRPMQYCKMVNAGDHQARYDEIYKEHSSMIAAVFNGYDFPEEIHILQDLTQAVTMTDSGQLLEKDINGSYVNIKDDQAFNESTRELVRNHNSIVRFNRAQKG